MRSVVAVCGALAASSHSALGLAVVYSGCDGLDEQPVRVVGVGGLFCVPLQPCEGSVKSGINGPLACPREGQQNVFGDVTLTTDSCCAVVDGASGALGCVLAGAEERKSVCLPPSASWRRERDFVRSSRRRRRSRRMQHVAHSLLPANSTGATPALVVRTDPSVATTTLLAAATAPAATTTLTPLSLMRSILVESVTAAPATRAVIPSVPVNSSSVPVVSTSAPFATATTVAVPVPLSAAPGLTPETAMSTIETTPSAHSSESSSSSGSGSTNSSSVVITTPLTRASPCTMGSECSDNGGLLLKASSADTSGPGPAAVGSPEPTLSSAPAADVEVRKSADSFQTSEPLSNESISMGTVENFSETRTSSTGSTVLDQATGASTNGSLVSSPGTAFLHSSSNSRSDKPSDSGSIAVNSVKNERLDNLGKSNVESSTENDVVPKPSLSRSSSSILPPSRLTKTNISKRLTPVPIESPRSKGVLQLSPITDNDHENSLTPLPSTDGGANGMNTNESNALGLNVLLFITVGSVVAAALMFGVFYLRPNRVITHDLLIIPEPSGPMDRTDTYPYNYSREVESTGLYDASRTPRGSYNPHN